MNNEIKIIEEALEEAIGDIEIDPKDFFDIHEKPIYGLKNKSKRRRGKAVIRGDSSESVLKYFKGDDLSANVYKDKYEFEHDSFENDSTPDSMHSRIAVALSHIESKYSKPLSENQIYKLLKDFKYVIPGGSVMYALNTGKMVSLGNCFVIGNHNEKDSYGSIIRRDEEQVQLMKRRGGVGHDLSFMRKKGSLVNNSAKTSTGVVPFAERYSNSIKEVAQDGRRGAGMLTLDINHGDSMEFIEAKANQNKITSANISLKVDNRFMKDVEVSAETDSLIKFRAIVKNARNFSEPGILFWDTVLEQIDAKLYADFMPISTNPCGELPLSPYESCRLMSLNLYSYVINPFTEDAEFDYTLFEKHVMMAQRLMDDIVDLEIEAIERILDNLQNEKYYYDFEENSLDVEVRLWRKILDKTKRGRRTGLGVTGLADMFAALNIPYASNESILIASDIFSSMMKNSYKSSIILAKERGAFPEYDKKEFESDVKDLNTVKELLAEEPAILKMWEKYGRRNIQNLAIAPTGTISIMTQTSSGVEPVFNLRYTRRRRAMFNDDTVFIKDNNGDFWEEFVVVHQKLNTWYNIYLDGKDGKELKHMSDKEFAEIVKKSPYAGCTTHEIDPIKKITLQGNIQEYIDSAISITHNLPEDVTEKEVYDMALYAWQIGCKGFTVYREGSRGGILINKKKEEKRLVFKDAMKRPKTLDCEIHMPIIKKEKWVVLVGTINGDPYEVFAFKNDKDLNLNINNKYTLKRVKQGVYSLMDKEEVVIDNIISYFNTPEEEFITRLISTSLRHGTKVRFVHEQLVKSKGIVTDFSKAIARVLNKYILKEADASKAELCPECGNIVKFEGGCPTCSCGWSKCN